MKFIRYRHKNRTGYGIIEDERVQALMSTPFESLELTGQTFHLQDIDLLAPVEAPPNILAIGRNYRQHAEETGADIPDHPLLFIKATSSLSDPESNIALPREAPSEVDYEAELAIVIGKRAKDVSMDAVPDHILGYTCANDVSARDCQLRKDGQWARGKSFDTFCPLGPWIETDLSPESLRIESRINGEIRQQSNTANLIFGCRELVSYLSRQLTLLPGTIILTGTPSGVGMASNPPRFLETGDVCEVFVEGIGVLRNTVTGPE